MRQWRRARAEREYLRRFSGDCWGCFWGVFTTLDAATRSAPSTKPVGYDHPQLAAEYRAMLEQENWEHSGRLLSSYDYPVLFWLRTLIDQEMIQSIFDLGGNVGVHFYAYGSLLDLPASIQWTICDLPAIVEAGRQIAAQRNVRLGFTDSITDIDNSDVFLASGSVQYLEDLAALLRAVRQRPRHLLINRLPLYDGERFVTLQNGGSVFYPQHVFNRQQFLGSIDELGYELVDDWEDHVDTCVVPFHPEQSIPSYRGLYLRVSEQSVGPCATSVARDAGTDRYLQSLLHGLST
jgi:putative methyltransferase (TIGR04325 family)